MLPTLGKTKEALRTGKCSSVVIHGIITVGMEDKFARIPEDFNGN